MKMVDILLPIIKDSVYTFPNFGNKQNISDNEKLYTYWSENQTQGKV